MLHRGLCTIFGLRRSRASRRHRSVGHCRPRRHCAGRRAGGQGRRSGRGRGRRRRRRGRLLVHRSRLVRPRLCLWRQGCGLRHGVGLCIGLCRLCPCHVRLRRSRGLLHLHSAAAPHVLRNGGGPHGNCRRSRGARGALAELLREFHFLFAPLGPVGRLAQDLGELGVPAVVQCHSVGQWRSVGQLHPCRLRRV